MKEKQEFSASTAVLISYRVVMSKYLKDFKDEMSLDTRLKVEKILSVIDNKKYCSKGRENVVDASI